MKKEKGTESSKTIPVKIDWDSVWSAQLIARNQADEIPPGFKTVLQIAKDLGASERITRYWAVDGRKNGTVEFKKFKIVSEKGRLMSVMHYRPIPKP